MVAPPSSIFWTRPARTLFRPASVQPPSHASDVTGHPRQPASQGRPSRREGPVRDGRIPARFAQSTSGASEMIFMNFLARSSRATGPKMRVPSGSRSLLIRTAELPSNLMKLPSGRPTPFAVRTITALATSPFFTLLLGRASRMETTMTSPIDAYLRFEPPSTLMQYTLFAPELSATSSTLDIWVIAVSSFDRPAPPIVRAVGSRDFSERTGDHPGLNQAFLLFSRTSTTRQRLSFELGLVSAMRTRSPSEIVGCAG